MALARRGAGVRGGTAADTGHGPVEERPEIGGMANSSRALRMRLRRRENEGLLRKITRLSMKRLLLLLRPCAESLQLTVRLVPPHDFRQLERTQ